MNRAERRASRRNSGSSAASATSADVPDVPKVVIGTVHPGEVSMSMMASVMRAKDHMLQYGIIPGFLERRARSQHVYKARNEIVAGFLDMDADYLLFVDADMGIPKNTIERLLAVAHVDDRPIVGALCFAQREVGFSDEDYSSRFDLMPTVQVWCVEDDEVTSFYIVEDYPRDEVCQIDATGAACVLIHRTVFEKMRAEHGDHWFTPLTNRPTGTLFGEDTSFFLRCRELSIPVHMDTTVKTSHDKGGVFLTEQLWDMHKALKA